MIDRLFRWLAPHHCLGCHQMGEILCHRCNDHILKQHKITLNHDLAKDLGVSQAFCLGWRRGLLRRLVDAYKFQLVRELSVALAGLMSGIIDDTQEFVLISLPTTRKHNRERGFDHMSLITRRLARQRGWRMAKILQRNHQVSQRGLKRADRLSNAEDMFSCSERLDPKLNYLILDDVYTTGGTLRAALSAMRAAGAKQISVAIIARQPTK